MSYRVFARKYRPQKFAELVGQAPIIQTLQNAITSNRLAQAYLFVGPRGVGKTSTARIFAKALNCVKGPTIDPCGVCDACLEIAEGRNLDVLEIDGASNNSVESIRTLRENAAFAPAQGKYKIYLIDEVHMLTTAAFNALLKTLEEPPPHVKFLFATTEAQKVPATIVSRCQRFDLHRLSEELMAKHLLEIATKEKINLTPEAAQALAHGADGALRDAESMLDQVVSFCGNKIEASDVQEVFGFTPRETVHQLATAVFQNDTPTALALLLEQSNAGKDLSRLLADFIGFVRDLLVEKVSPTSDDSFFAKLGTLVSTEKLLSLLEELGNAEGRLRWSTNKKLQLDIIIIKAIHLLQEVSLSDVLDALSDLADPQAAKQSALPQLKLKVEVEEKKNSTTPKIANPDQSPEVFSTQKIISQQIKSPVDVENNNTANDSALTSTSTSNFNSCEARPNVWTAVAEQLSTESKLKFGWMPSGKFLEQRDNKIIVEFPPSCEAQTETLFWPQARKKIQECLSKNCGRPMELVPQFTGEELAEELHEEIIEEEISFSSPAPAPTKPAAPKVSSKAPSDPPVTGTPLTPEALANFKNDPLIQEALEIFKGEIVTLQ
ncbi:MAG: DNA polymerase III subunit gamma/tau [Verrucomicrobia bacterium]|nr:DNA polymerase III subunit gamma/tau [Verrucomicrobiota bacterium]